MTTQTEPHETFWKVTFYALMVVCVLLTAGMFYLGSPELQELGQMLFGR